MPNIDNGNHSIKINGNQLQVQGFARLRKDIPTDVAAEKTRNNGVDEVIVEYQNEKGETERAIAWGDKLDFSFTKSKAQPQVTVDGRPARIRSYENEATSFGEGALRGVKDGYKDAFQAVGNAGKQLISNLPIAAGATFVGGTAAVVAAKTVGIVAVKAAFAAMAPAVGTGAAWIGGAAIVGIGVAGALRGGFEAAGKEAKMETIAAVTEDAGPVAPITPREGERGDLRNDPKYNQREHR
ncbi:MAG TPA: hypothetical protein V6C82_06940 [Chroococcales cyanobacterium]|jgi:hypothetical protein